MPTSSDAENADSDVPAPTPGERSGRGLGRISIFMGKGGVGRTTLALALALDRARAGERVIFLSPVLARGEARARLEADGATIPDTLTLLEPDPRKLVDDIVRKLTRLGPLAEAVLRQPAYQSFTDIVPGVREMALFNLVHNLRHEGKVDRIVVDAPATGHGIHFLEAPEKTMNMLVGKLKQRAQLIQDMLHDPESTEVVIVTLPEETPVRESMDLAAKLQEHKFPLDTVIVNKWLPEVLPENAPGTATLHKLNADAEARRQLARTIAHHTRVDVDQWLVAVNLVRGQRLEAERHVHTLSKFARKLHVIPHVPDARGRLTRIVEAMHALPPVVGGGPEPEVPAQ